MVLESLSSKSVFFIVGGLYSITALRKTGAEDKVCSKHRELKQASKQASKRHNQDTSRYIWFRLSIFF
jgi:hypothetical protein